MYFSWRCKNGTNSVLVVSTDEDRVEHKSGIFELKDFMSGPSRMIFDEDEWVGGMWVSQTGKHYLSEVLGSCYANATVTSFEQEGRIIRTMYEVWRLAMRRSTQSDAEGPILHV